MMDPNAVVGVNGDFFDIRDTEAPLGVGRDRQRGILNGVQSGWNSAFWIDTAGLPHIGDLYADAVLRQRPHAGHHEGELAVGAVRRASGSTPRSGARCASTGSSTASAAACGWS